MKCYKHPNVDAVAQCAHCGVGLCAECESSAYFRIGAGSGQALCTRCSYETAKENYAYAHGWMKNKIIRLIIAVVLVIIGLIFLLVGLFGSVSDEAGFIVTCFCFWFAAGLSQVIKNKYATDNRTTEQQVSDAIEKKKHPVTNVIGKVLGYTIGAPIGIIFGVIGILRSLKDYKKSKTDLNEITNILNYENSMQAQTAQGENVLISENSSESAAEISGENQGQNALE